MAWSCRKNARHRNSKKDVQKAVCNKTKRKTKNEMIGWRVHGPERDGNKRMERQSKGWRGLEAYCKGGQGPPWAVAPSKKNCYYTGREVMKTTMKAAARKASVCAPPWRWTQYISPKRWWAVMKLHDVISQNTAILCRNTCNRVCKFLQIFEWVFEMPRNIFSTVNTASVVIWAQVRVLHRPHPWLLPSHLFSLILRLRAS